jgi:hypothetical protein
VLGKKNKVVIAPPWRPDFRVIESLPDTKVVRTGFLMNFVALVIAVAVVGYGVFTEYQIRTLDGQIARLQERIAGRAVEHRRQVQMSTQFQQMNLQLDQMHKFDGFPFTTGELWAALSGLRRDALVFAQMTYQPYAVREGRTEKSRRQFTLQGVVYDRPEMPAAARIVEFQADMRSMPVWSEWIETMLLSGFVRAEADNAFNFTIQVSLDFEKGKRK